MNKHLKRLILVALTLTMALSCLPVFTAFADEEAEPAKPTTATLTIDSEELLFDIDETISFAVAGDGTREEIWLTAPGESKATALEKSYNDQTVKLSFSTPGEYKAYVLTWLGEESLKSKEITFFVGAPTLSTISAQVTTCNVGGSISFHTETDNGVTELLVYVGDSEEYTTVETVDGVGAVTFDAAGTYRVQAKSSNAIGECLSEEITVTVLSGLSIPNPGKNENPTTTTAQVPQPADYTWLIVLGVVLAVILIIVLIVVVKINKKKKKAHAAQQ